MTRKHEHKYKTRKIAHDVKNYGAKIEEQLRLWADRSIELAKFYTPKIKHSVIKYSKIYRRKFKEAYIAFRKDY